MPDKPQEQDPRQFALGIAELQIPHDIEVGLLTAISDMEKYLRSGFVETLGLNVGDMLDQAAKALDSKIEWTEAGRSKFESMLKEIVKRNIFVGFQNYIGRIAGMVRTGRLEIATIESRSGKKFFDLAKSVGVQLSVGDIDLNKTEDIVETFGSYEDVEKYIKGVVAENLLEGIANRISGLGRFVASGDDFGRINPNEVSREVDVMVWHALHTYGFEEDTEPVIKDVAVEKFDHLHGQKKVCLAEISALKDKEVAENLASGVRNTMTRYGKNILYEYACRDGLRKFYQEQAEKYDLVDESLETLTDGQKVNLTLWGEAVAEQVKLNFQSSVESIPAKFLEKIRDGRISPSKDQFEHEIESHLELAKKYDIAFNPQETFNKLLALITPENLQAGVDRLLERAREAITSGYPWEAQMAVADSLLPGIIAFIKLQGMEDLVDTTKILSYLKENGLKLGSEEREKLGRRNSTRLLVEKEKIQDLFFGDSSVSK